ncbi:MAG TPA: VOC family protein [Candidatus Saccharimonadales bacterium]|jgi:predicted enzyme related to lactoylglutathione lyase
MDIEQAFSSFAVSNLDRAEEFYRQTLGLDVKEETQMGLLTLNLPEGLKVTVYPKQNHVPAAFTVLNFVVKDIDTAVGYLTKQGVKFEIYEGFEQDEKGIARSRESSAGPSIAWFKDSEGNIMSVLEDSPQK